MFSKMMAPDAARNYAESVKRQAKDTPVVLTENKIETKKTEDDQKKKVKPVVKTGNANWEKFKETLVSKSNTQKSPSKRQMANPGDNQKGKRKAKGKNAPHAIKSISTASNIMASMDLENLELTKQVAMDCEMVGIGDGTESMIARVSLVNRHGACLYDKYVKPRETVQDYRTAVSGIRPYHLQSGEEFSVVQKEVADIIRGRILVGHALKNDLNVLFLSHPKRHLRDTSRYSLFRQVASGNTPSLKKLAAELLGIDIQSGEHSSVEDARAAMQLYVLYKKRWEYDLSRR